jgi:hypothetical protein
MTGIGEKLWEIGRSPPQHLTLLVFGLVALLVGLISTSMLDIVGPGSAAAIGMAALFLTAVGGFFVTLALFIGAYTATGESVTATVWRIAQLLTAVLVLVSIF